MASIGNIQVIKTFGKACFYLAAIAVMLYSCSDEKEKPANIKKPQGDTVKKPEKKIRMSFDFPASNVFIASGEVIPVEASPKIIEEQPDSATLFINEKPVAEAKEFPLVYEWNTADEKLGKYRLKLISWFNGEKEEIFLNLQI